MGSLRDCTWILGLVDYRVVKIERQDDGRVVLAVERRAALCVFGLWTPDGARP